MTSSTAFDLVPPQLRAPLTERGFTRLTAVQEAVLRPENAGRDLRISSQTGSGKTVAVGMLLADRLERASTAGTKACRPRALIITPTRELAAQVGTELAWLLRDVKARVLTVTGGTNVRGEQRALSHGAEVVVGTPGRLLDHLKQEVIDATQVNTVVLDEADQMLDLGFRDELEAILEKMPTGRRTHLVSATFSREVLALARRYQDDALHVEGSTLGASNVDIRHVVHLVHPPQLGDAVINLLLLAPDELTLIFVRTRADAANMAERLVSLGFNAAGLTGEMEQAARTRVMNAFRSGVLRTLVATDVAARGIDVPDVTRVIHADPPNDPDVYTHRSGRTGRAGRKGTSIMLVPPAALPRVTRLLRTANVKFEHAVVPDAAAILAASDERILSELTTPPTTGGEDAWEPHLHGLATRLLEQVEPVTLVHRLLARLDHHGPCPPRSVSPVSPPAPRARQAEGAEAPRARGERRVPAQGWVAFRISSGSRFGMDARRLLATVCRRGNIRGADVGAIKIGTMNSTFDVAGEVAAQFADAAARPDPRSPRETIEPLHDRGGPAPRERPSPEEPRTPYHPVKSPAAEVPRPSPEERPRKPARASYEAGERKPGKPPRASYSDERRAPGKPTRPSYKEEGRAPGKAPRPSYKEEGRAPGKPARPSYKDEGRAAGKPARPSYKEEGRAPGKPTRPPYKEETRPPARPSRPSYKEESRKPEKPARPTYERVERKAPRPPHPKKGKDSVAPARGGERRPQRRK